MMAALWTPADLVMACAAIALATALVVLMSRVVLGIRQPPLRREAAADDCAFASAAEGFGLSAGEALRERGIAGGSAQDNRPVVPGLPRREQAVLDSAPKGAAAAALATIGYAAAWPSRRRALFAIPTLLLMLLFAVWFAAIAVIIPLFGDIYNQLGRNCPG